jgi:flap endonuclease-1
MGIKNLLSLIKSQASSSISHESFASLSQKRIAIDSYILFYASSIATNFSGPKGKVLQDDSGTPTAHLIQILNHSVHYKINSISPFWVFDGEPPSLKKHELSRRKALKEENILKSESTSNILLQQKYSARAFRLTDQMIEDSKTLVSLLGHNFSVSPSEAEAQCAYLAKEGVVDVVLSQDSDCLVFGAPFVMRGKEFEMIDLWKALNELQLSMDQFVDLAVLLGSDYGKGIKGIGQVRALQMIKKFGNIEEVWKEACGGQSGNEELDRMKEIREFFKKPFGESGKVEKGVLDFSELQMFLKRKCFSEKSIERYLGKLM